jgi:hypothetical protein
MACLWRLRTARYAFLFCYALMERRACAFRVESLHVVPFRAFKHSRSGSNSVTTRGPARQAFRPRSRLYNDRDSQPDKFSFQQRVESVKCFVVGGVSGAVAMSPASALRNFILGNSLAQWEFDTDMGSLEAGLFAIVYRYCVREDDNPQLSSGCVGAFAVVRTLARMDVSESCTTIPLYCKDRDRFILGSERYT